MNSNQQNTIISSLAQEVQEGLTAFPKYLSSKFFYDKKGDALFQQIMALPEYYLTEAEHSILISHSSHIANSFSDQDEGFDLIELGAGDGKKTKVLLKELLSTKKNFTYHPIDISKNAVDGLVASLNTEFPELDVQGQIGEYFEVLDRLQHLSSRKKVIMVLGSNIGNLKHPRAIDFLKRLRDVMNTNDLLFMGFDQKKNPQTVLNAYNDTTGITAAFNKNILTRINKELDSNFDLDTFIHWETYDPESGTAKSFLVSTKKQTIAINDLDLQIQLEAWETIHTEISQKYDDEIVSWLADEAGLQISESFTDSQKRYKNYIFNKK
ncbi:L-histidine N(alpha)-methyltransferase [Aquimarina sp. W85]|uniref:L-histidine N(alpha)-methyltransferase n=1 Tax=Aquimarina rhodophyticola TaxID=3342246 RepID=UPI00366A98AA